MWYIIYMSKTNNNQTGDKMVTVAEKIINGKVVRRYVLKQDARGYYFDGADCASFRRKTRNSIESRMSGLGFDISDIEMA